ncbi:MAG: fimbrial protein [Porphyromonas sp.]|nr:fimbrial protein [Porphyromonas sp.]
MNKFFIHVLSVTIVLSLVFSCKRADEMDVHGSKVAADNVELSFAIKMNNYSASQSSHLRGTITDRDIEYGEVEGTENENDIKKLWVFLFDNSDDELKYIFQFSRDAADPENQLTGPYEQLNGLYRTPVKLVKPGRYTLVISANTYQFRFHNDHTAIGFGDMYIEGMTPVLGMKRGFFAASTSSTHFVNDRPAHDRDPETNGLNANYVNLNFIVPKDYTSKREPFVVPISLTRVLSKLVVTIDNLNNQSEEVVQTRDYRLHEVVVVSSKLYKSFLRPWYLPPMAVGMRTAWYTHGILPLPTAPSPGYSVKPNNGLMKDKFPLLKKLNEQGFTERLEETELFNYYIPPWSTGSDPQTDTRNTTKLILVFKHKTTGDEERYEVPLYNTKNGQKDYTINPNTVYKLRLSFRIGSIRCEFE